MQKLSPETIEALDPGIRRTVLWLRQMGFETTDSGDGRSKPKDEEVEPYPHVHMVLPSLRDAPAAVTKLSQALDHFGFAVVQFGTGGGEVVEKPIHGEVWLQVIHDAAIGVTVLSLAGVDDDMLVTIEAGE